MIISFRSARRDREDTRTARIEAERERLLKKALRALHDDLDKSMAEAKARLRRGEPPADLGAVASHVELRAKAVARDALAAFAEYAAKEYGRGG